MSWFALDNTYVAACWVIWSDFICAYIIPQLWLLERKTRCVYKLNPTYTSEQTEINHFPTERFATHSTRQQRKFSSRWALFSFDLSSISKNVSGTCPIWVRSANKPTDFLVLRLSSSLITLWIALLCQSLLGSVQSKIQSRYRRYVIFMHYYVFSSKCPIPSDRQNCCSLRIQPPLIRSRYYVAFRT